MNEPMSALFFLKLIEIDCDFFWPELKTQANSLNVFFKFSNKLIWFFLWFVSPGFFFFVFLIRKKQIVGDTNQLWSISVPHFFLSKTQKNKIQGAQATKKIK